MELGLERKVGIVTGGASGIGRGIAERLVTEGVSTALFDIDGDSVRKTAAELGKNAVAFEMDVSKKRDVEAAVRKVLERFGKIDILVNNAALKWSQRFIDIKEDDWDRIGDVNVKGVYLVTRPVLSHMVNRQYGKIINISSNASKEGIPNLSLYAATKYAVIGLTQALANEYAEFDLNINAVCPGVVRTPLWEAQLSEVSRNVGKSSDVFFQELCELIPFKRPQSPEDIAAVVAFLASDLAKNITGQSINVTGGWHMH